MLLTPPSRLTPGRSEKGTDMSFGIESASFGKSNEGWTARSPSICLDESDGLVSTSSFP
jgi:hypothetical protein